MTNKNKGRINRFKTGLLVMLCLVLMMPSQFAFANKYSEYESVELREGPYGVFKSYEPVNLMIRGIDVFSDAPGIVVNQRTIVPISAILMELDIPYQWNGTTKEISFSHNGKSVVMQLDNVYATVNGVRTLLPDGVAPRAMTYRSTTGEYVDRTYVPLKFVSDMLGLTASWIPETRTVAINKKAQTLSGAYLDVYKQFPEIRLKVSGEVDATSFVIAGADVGAQDKIVIDLQNTEFKIPEGGSVKDGVWTYRIFDGIFGLDKIEITQTATNPFNTRVTVYQNERRGHDISYDAKTGEMVIRLINTVNSVVVEDIYSTDTVVIGTSENPNYSVDVLGNKIIVDVISSYLKVNNGAFQVLPVDKGHITAISYSQLDTSTGKYDYYDKTDVVTRVVIELDEPAEYDKFFVEDIKGNLYVYVADNPVNNFDYVKLNNEKSTLRVNLFEDTAYTVDYDAASKLLSIDIPKDKTDLGAFENAVKDHIVESFAVLELENAYRILVTLSDNTTYVKSNATSEVLLTFTNTVIQDSDFKGTLIVIDAGHGGKDPGAVGSKVQEKALTLKAAQMLESALLKQGFKVYMTRSTDEYVGLYERAAMANDLNATLFVSIHINAFTNPSVNGVEVLYGNESMSSDKGLAQSIQKELIAALGANDRGIASRPRLVVLRETKMTSVLAELGFLSNATEQDNLMKDAYLQKAANAMAKAIVNFLK